MTATAPVITVITVVRNDAAALRKTIASVLSQDCPGLEFILVDGGSTDGTVEVIRAHEARISWWVSEPDHGIYDAMNKGLKHATGTWVNFMNAGDVFASGDAVTKVLAAGLDDCAVVYGDSYAAFPHGLVHRVAGTPEMLIRGMVFCHQAAFVRREVITPDGFDLDYPIGADFKVFFSLYTAGRQFRKLPFPVAIFEASGVSNLRMVQSACEHYSIVKRYTRLSCKHRWHHWSFIAWVSLVSLGYRLLPAGMVQWGRKLRNGTTNDKTATQDKAG